MKKIQSIALLSCLIFTPLLAQEYWVVSLHMDQSSLEDQTWSWASQLYERMETLEIHTLSVQERENLRQRDVDTALNGLYQSLENAMDTRDRLIYQDSTEQQYLVQDQAIATQRQAIEAYEPPPLEDYPEVLPLQFQEFNVDNPFYPLEQENLTSHYRFDLESETLGDRSRLSLYGTSLDQERELIWQGWLSYPRQKEQLNEMEDLCRSVLLGRPWASVPVVVAPLQASVFLEDELLGIGQMELRQLEPGLHNFRVEAPGYLSQIFELDLTEGRNTPVQWSLERGELTFLQLTSEPLGAHVYLGSQWMGQTPLEIPLPEENLPLLIQAEEYGQFFLGTQELNEDFHVRLRPLDGDMQDILELKKKRLYQSLGIFTLSLVAPIILNGMQLDKAEIYNHYVETGGYSQGQLDQAWQEYINHYYAFYGALGLSAGTFGYSLYRLIDYIRFSERAILED